MVQLLNSFCIQKVLGGSCPVCSSIVMMQQQSVMLCSWASFSDCSNKMRQTLSGIPSTSHYALSNMLYGCYMTCAMDKNSNHLLGNRVTAKEFLRGSLSDRDPLLRLLRCFEVKTVYPCFITTYDVPNSI